MIVQQLCTVSCHFWTQSQTAKFFCSHQKSTNHLLQNSCTRQSEGKGKKGSCVVCTSLICIKLTFRLLPYGRMSFGLFLVLLNIAACLVGKGVSMFTIDFGRNATLEPHLRSEVIFSQSSKPTMQSLYVVLAWICINILPQMLFVSKSFSVQFYLVV